MSEIEHLIDRLRDDVNQGVPLMPDDAGEVFDHCDRLRAERDRLAVAMAEQSAKADGLLERFL